MDKSNAREREAYANKKRKQFVIKSNGKVTFYILCIN